MSTIASTCEGPFKTEQPAGCNSAVNHSPPSCSKCGEPAVASWPAASAIDLVSRPYCRSCLDSTRYQLLIKMDEYLHFNPFDEDPITTINP